MSGALTPAGSINDLRTQALGAIAGRLATLDLSQLLVYVIKNVPTSALPFLAWQFDILSPFWQLLEPGADQATLIEQSIALHRLLGTPAAIKTAIQNLGWNPPTILEGQNSWGGSSYPADQGWAVFQVKISKTTTSGNPTTVSSTQQSQVLDGIQFFKPARSVLDSCWFIEVPLNEPGFNFTDSFTLTVGPVQVEPAITITDEPTVIGWMLRDTFTVRALHNAFYFHAGGINYGASSPSFVSVGPLIVNGSNVSSK